MRRARIIDVSHHQDGPGSRLIDWDGVAKAVEEGEVDAVILRTGDGKDVDREAEHNREGALRLGVPIGWYHYVRGRHGAMVNLETVHRALDDHQPELGLWLDVEGHPDEDERRHLGAYLGPDPTGFPALSRARVLDVVLEMAEMAEEAGYTVGVYGNWGLRPLADEARIGELARFPLWIPWYRTPGRPASKWPLPAPWRKRGDDAWLIHQWTNVGSIEGVFGCVDLNAWNGTAEDMQRWIERAARERMEVAAPVGPVDDETLRRDLRYGLDAAVKAAGGSISWDG